MKNACKYTGYFNRSVVSTSLCNLYDDEHYNSTPIIQERDAIKSQLVSSLVKEWNEMTWYLKTFIITTLVIFIILGILKKVHFYIPI